MRLHDKVGALLELRPDVAVLPECACPEVLFRRCPEIGASDFAWTGPHPAKGLAVLAFGPWRVKRTERHDARAASAALHVSGPAEVRLLALWALPPWGRPHRPPEPAARVVERWRAFLTRTPAIIAGDFHQTLVGRGARPSPLARRLAALGFTSACPDATFFPYRRPHRGYHADHVFLDAAASSALRSVATGAAHWLSVSDHLPVAVDLALE